MKDILPVTGCKKRLSFKEDIVYSPEHGLRMSLLMRSTSADCKRVPAPAEDEESSNQLHPAILSIPGGGFRHCERNCVLPAMHTFADAGYVVASIDYRLAPERKHPAQIHDVCQAIMYLKAHSEEYGIDPDRIAVLGRSAGGCLAVLAGMNTGEWDIEGQPNTKVAACIDMYGMVDLEGQIDAELSDHFFSNVTDPLETLTGAYLGGDRETLMERAREASPLSRVNPAMAPMLVLHGDNDPVIGHFMSERLYEAACAAGLEDRVEYHLIPGAGHGSHEFFQPEVDQLILNFLERTLG